MSWRGLWLQPTASCVLINMPWPGGCQWTKPWNQRRSKRDAAHAFFIPSLSLPSPCNRVCWSAGGDVYTLVGLVGVIQLWHLTSYINVLFWMGQTTCQGVTTSPLWEANSPVSSSTVGKTGLCINRIKHSLLGYVQQVRSHQDPAKTCRLTIRFGRAAGNIWASP